MDPFLLLLIAAALWIAAIVAFLVLRRRTPGPPVKTVSEFQEHREHLASIEHPTSGPDVPDPAASRLVRSLEGLELEIQPEGPEEEPAEREQDVFEEESTEEFQLEPSTEAPQEAASVDAAEPPPRLDENEEEQEVASLIQAISTEEGKGGRRKPSQTPKARSKPHRGPITVGRTTYVLVDDEGRPLLDD